MPVVSFLFPIVGWVYWGIKKKEDPEKASLCAKCAWIGFAVGCALRLLKGLIF